MLKPKSLHVLAILALILALLDATVIHQWVRRHPGGAPDAGAPAATVPTFKRPEGARPWIVDLRFQSDITPASVQDAAANLRTADAARPDAIVLEINTSGGQVGAGVDFARAIESVSTPLVCVVDGEASSMGYYVLQSCPMRIITRRSSLMIHEPFFPDGAEDAHTATELEQAAHNLRTTAATMLEHESRRMKVAKSVVAGRIADGKRWYLLADEAVRVGAVDGVAASVEEVLGILRHPPER